MDDRTPAADAQTQSGADDRGAPPVAPRWVKLFGIIAAVVIVVLLILLLTGGNHGPGRHMHGGLGLAPGVPQSVQLQ